MRIPKAAAIAAATVVILTAVGAMLAYRTAKWALEKVHPAPVSTGVAQSAPGRELAVSAARGTPSAQEQPSHLRRSGAMAKAFQTGQLPTPMPIPAGNPDDVAKDLAKKIAAADDQSTAALMTAIQMSGFSIRGKDGAIAVKPIGPSQGMAYDALSIAAMAKLYNDGWAMSFDDLATVLSKTITATENNETLSHVLLSGISRAAQGDQPVRFWARTIVELGHQASPAYDLTDPKLDLATVQLDAIQVSFILQRVAGDLSSHAKRQAPSRKAYYRINGADLAQLEPAVFHPSRGARLVLVEKPSPGFGSPCGETADTIMDALSILKSNVFVGLEEEGAVGMGPLNAALAILRFIYIYASMNVKITMDNPPLIRSYDLDKGETRVVTAHVWFEMHEWPCILWLLMRGAASRNEIDVGSLPTNAEGIGVEWELLKGGVPLSNSRDPGFLEAQHSAIVMFDNGGGSDGATWNKDTDANGDSPIKISGRPQRWDMTYMKRFPVKKKMSVLVKIAYKHNGSADKFLSEILDALGPALGVAKGDIFSGLVGAIAETMFRMHWYCSDEYEFPVQDWVPCKQGWGGTVTYSRSLHQAHQVGTTTTADDWVETATLTLAGGETKSTVRDGTFSGTSQGYWSGDYERHQLNNTHVTMNGQVCRSEGDEVNNASFVGSGSGELNVNVTAGPNGPSQWRYEVIPYSDPTPSFPLNGTFTSGEAISGEKGRRDRQPGCESAAFNNIETTTGVLTQRSLVNMVRGPMDPEHPTEIHDTQQTTDPISGASMKISVDLQRCER